MSPPQSGEGSQQYCPSFLSPAAYQCSPGSLGHDSMDRGSGLFKTGKEKKTSAHPFPEASVTALLCTG